MEDASIIELFWKRDETAIQELSSKYTGYCYKIAWNLLQNHEDAEECLNDTWFAAWGYMPPQRPSVLSVFVGRITRGLAIDRFRKKHAAKRADGHMEDVCGEMDEISFSYTLDEQMAEKELINVIEAFLRKLSDADRDIFIRRYWYLDTIKEIAKRHGVSEGCIKTNLCRNRKKLCRILKREVIA
ncbi:MAG: sigma-70 family RNA polymerase sigma factor [Lachnospiraceae bacterium]|nr:sigma-70 family RNA polymerase sigma factor [Lachnospiraceae bacterium]